MKKISYKYEVTRFLSEEDSSLSLEQINEKYWQEGYEFYRMLKDDGIGDELLFTTINGMDIREEEPGEREQIRSIKARNRGIL